MLIAAKLKEEMKTGFNAPSLRNNWHNNFLFKAVMI
jgi:hypothetical protein